MHHDSWALHAVVNRGLSLWVVIAETLEECLEQLGIRHGNETSISPSNDSIRQLYRQKKTAIKIKTKEFSIQKRERARTDERAKLTSSVISSHSMINLMKHVVDIV
jgi:hypothetical protein